MSVSKRARFEVMRRDNFTCRYCRSTDNPLTVDHVVPTALGGTDLPDNLVACCEACNSGKTSTMPDGELVDEVREVDRRWADAIARAAEDRRIARSAALDCEDAFLAIWGARWLPGNWASTLGALYAAGLPLDDMREAADVATTSPGVRSRFPYFCGVSWRIVRDLQDAARILLEAEQTPMSDGPRVGKHTLSDAVERAVKQLHETDGEVQSE